MGAHYAAKLNVIQDRCHPVGSLAISSFAPRIHIVKRGIICTGSEQRPKEWSAGATAFIKG
jgi:hypothetical protein